MSWPVYQQATAANAVQNYSTQSTAIPGSSTTLAAGGVNMDAYQHMTPEQQFAIQQQNWQQWQIYQQQYAQWQAQYGEQYQREMQNKMMNQNALMTNVMQGPPPPPPDSSVPPPPPEQNVNSTGNYQQTHFSSEMPPTQNDLTIHTDRMQPSSVDRRPTRQFVPAENTAQLTQYQQPPPPPPPPSQANMQQPPPSLNQSPLAPESQYANKNIRPPSQSNTSIQTNQGGNARINPNRFFDRNPQRDDNSDSFGGFQSGRNNNNRHNWNNRGRNNNNNNNNNNSNNSNNNNNNSRNNFASNNDVGNRNSSIDRGNSTNNNNFRGGNNFRRNENDDGYTQQQPQFSNNVEDMNRTECNREDDDDALDDDSNKTPEEIAFDEQFRKWEEQFMNWKRDNANHPDRKAYNDYESKMEECRSKLLQRRAEMRQRRAAAMKSKIIDQSDMVVTQTVVKDDENDNEMSQSDESQVAGNAGSTGESREQNASVFGVASNSESGIPGLDLVDELTAPEKMSNVAQSEVTTNLSAINNILGDPNIKSLLSNIQKQQQQDVSQNTTNEPNTSDQMQQQPAASFFSNHNTFNNQNRVNPFNRGNQDANQHEQQQQFHADGRSNQRHWNCNSQNSNQDSKQGSRAGAPFQSLLDLDIQNPFRSMQNQRDDCNQRHHQGFQTESDNDFNGDGGNGNGRQRKRNRRRSLRRDNQNQNPWQQNNSNNNNQDNARPFGNDDFNDDDDYDMNNKRARVPSSGNDSQSYSGDFYRPATIIDYQNQSQPPPGALKPDHMKSAEEIDMDYFPRKIIEYNHKSKIHVLQTLCPVTLFDYKHKPEGYIEEEPVEVKSRLFPWHRSQPPQRKVPPAKQKSILSRMPSLLQDLRGNTQQVPHPSSVHQPPNERTQWMRGHRNQYASSLMSESMKEKPPTFPCTSARDINDGVVTPITLAPPEPRQKRREHLVNIDDILLLPGRVNRPKKIVIFMRGPPGSGKSYVAKLIKEKETEMGGSARILSVDDYFTTETDVEQTLPNGKKVLTKKLSYEYDAQMEENYMQYVIKSFKKTITDGLFNLVIVDCNNCQLRHYTDMYNFARTYTFTPYTCEMPLDLQQCLKNNIHQRTSSDIQKAIAEWVEAPPHNIQLNYRPLLDAINTAASDDKMELDAISDDDQESNEPSDVISSSHNDPDADEAAPNEFGFLKSKWDTDTTENKLARLDGINKPIKHTTIEDYLQMEGWEPPPSSSNGKKRVRWADIEEKRERDKQRAIGFVVGQTNWSHLVDDAPSNSNESSALTKIKYI